MKYSAAATDGTFVWAPAELEKAATVASSRNFFIGTRDCPEIKLWCRSSSGTNGLQLKCAVIPLQELRLV